MSLRITILLAVILVTAGCHKAAARRDASTMSQVQSNQVLVVGKIQIIPPLKKNEQLLKKSTEKAFRNKVFVLYDDQKFDMNDLPVKSTFAAGLVDIGKTFFIPADRDKQGNVYFSGAAYITYDGAMRRGSTGGIHGMYSALRSDHVKLPGGIKFKTRNTMRAVYVGTLQFYRDEFNGITRVAYKDEYGKARKLVNAKYKGRKLHRVKAEKW